MPLALTLIPDEAEVFSAIHFDPQVLADLKTQAVAERLAFVEYEPKMYYKPKETAEHLTFGLSQLREQVAAGEFPPPVLVGGYKRYTREQLNGIAGRR